MRLKAVCNKICYIRPGGTGRWTSDGIQCSTFQHGRVELVPEAQVLKWPGAPGNKLIKKHAERIHIHLCVVGEVTSGHFGCSVSWCTCYIENSRSKKTLKRFSYRNVFMPCNIVIREGSSQFQRHFFIYRTNHECEWIEVMIIAFTLITWSNCFSSRLTLMNSTILSKRKLGFHLRRKPKDKHETVHFSRETRLNASISTSVITMGFLRSSLGRHCAGKPVIASRNIGYFFRLR